VSDDEIRDRESASGRVSSHLIGARKEGSNWIRDSVYVLQRCTHPRFVHCETGPIHAAPRDMTCVSPASFLCLRDIEYRVLGSEQVTADQRQMRVGARLD